MHERLSRLPPGYKKQRHTVPDTALPGRCYPADRPCAGCGELIGLSRRHVRHYRWYHLECWQKAFPVLAAADKETRGEI